MNGEPFGDVVPEKFLQKYVSERNVLYLTTGYADAGSLPLYKDSTPDVIVNQACVIPPTLFFKYSLTSGGLANHITNSQKHRFSANEMIVTGKPLLSHGFNALKRLSGARVSLVCHDLQIVEA